MRKNNLKEYKQKQLETNKNLVQRAIEHLKKIGGNINITSVSRTTKEIADAAKGEKGLTAAALSKNKLYKTMILKAKAETIKIDEKCPTGLSLGDLELKLYQERQKNEELKIKIKILEDQLSKISLINQSQPKEEKNGYYQDCIELREENKHLRSLLKGVIYTLSKLEIVENVDGDIKVSLYGTTLIDKENSKYLK